MVYLERLIEKILAHCAPPALSCRDSLLRRYVATSCLAHARGGYCSGRWGVIALEKHLNVLEHSIGCLGGSGATKSRSEGL